MSETITSASATHDATHGVAVHHRSAVRVPSFASSDQAAVMDPRPRSDIDVKAVETLEQLRLCSSPSYVLQSLDGVDAQPHRAAAVVLMPPASSCTGSISTPHQATLGFVGSCTGSGQQGAQRDCEVRTRCMMPPCCLQVFFTLLIS